MSSALDNDTYSDFTITCKGRTWNVHKVIVCTKSKFLALGARSQLSEGVNQTIEFSKESPELINDLLRAMYEPNTVNYEAIVAQFKPRPEQVKSMGSYGKRKRR